jgi:hypothetical protein
VLAAGDQLPVAGGRLPVLLTLDSFEMYLSNIEKPNSICDCDFQPNRLPVTGYRLLASKIKNPNVSARVAKRKKIFLKWQVVNRF